MLYWIYSTWLEASQDGEAWAKSFKFLNLLGYITVRAGLAITLSFLLSLLLGPRVIRKLISLKIGQPVRTAEEVHKLAELHGQKAGTPTMGGILILGAVLFSVVLCADPLNPFVTATCVVMFALGLLGFVDDYKKITEKSSEGVSSRTKLFWQVLIGGVGAVYLYTNPETSRYLIWYRGADSFEAVSISGIGFPLFRGFVVLGLFCLPFFIVLLTGTSNAVNLTDGLDGLAIGCTITTAGAYGVIAYLAGTEPAAKYLHILHNRSLAELCVPMFALAGAGLGFLWHNCHPAKVFMGDTGSLAIGGGLGMAAICTKQELLLIIIGGIFVMEAVSVMLQVGSYKLRKKRIFAMAPIHHHFELRGWHENQVIIRFWIISALLAGTGLALLKVL